MLSPTGQEQCVIFDATWQECEIKMRVAVAVYASLIAGLTTSITSLTPADCACAAEDAARVFMRVLRTDGKPS